MGHSRAAKLDTHKRIVAIASKRLREEGLAGVGVADLMKEAGLTVGGFYKHFGSREDLVEEAVGSALGAWRARVEAATAGGPPVTFKTLVDEYLSKRHRDNTGGGCALAALAADAARGTPGTRKLFTDEIARNIDLIAGALASKAPGAEAALEAQKDQKDQKDQKVKQSQQGQRVPARAPRSKRQPLETVDARALRAKAILAYSALVGALNMARVVSDEGLSQEILSSVAEALDHL